MPISAPLSRILRVGYMLRLWTARGNCEDFAVDWTQFLLTPSAVNAFLPRHFPKMRTDFPTVKILRSPLSMHQFSPLPTGPITITNLFNL